MNDSSESCPFCNLSGREVLAESQHALAIRDAFPVSEGHTLVIPRRHVEDLFELLQAELAELVTLVRQTKNDLHARFSPSGFNIGVNIGRAAGQTIMHAHVHIIPRHAGDVADPTGGIRNVIPGKGRYTQRHGKS